MQGLTVAERNIVTACLVGLITYIFHGVLNNFLDMDKIAALFWGYMAIILAFKHKAGLLKLKSED
jgi:hypothetical protein